MVRATLCELTSYHFMHSIIQNTVATVAFVQSAFSVSEGSTTVDNTELVCLEVMLPANSMLERDVVAQVTPSDGTASKTTHHSDKFVVILAASSTHVASGEDYTTDAVIAVTFSPSNTNAQCIQLSLIHI